MVYSEHESEPEAMQKAKVRTRQILSAARRITYA